MWPTPLRRVLFRRSDPPARGVAIHACLSRSWLSTQRVAAVLGSPDLMLMGYAAAVVEIACDFQPKAEAGLAVERRSHCFPGGGADRFLAQPSAIEWLEL